ncbi:hypothetical protein AB5J55_43645 [Streptomyces sp. R11]|uniref:Uncharacterized protein n=1 Tax=Streptomyces sp. R11 TaxID=3238625 RepID=A0AB39NC23_9ACTN
MSIPSHASSDGLPTSDHLTALVRSALQQAEEHTVDEVAPCHEQADGCTRRLRSLHEVLFLELGAASQWSDCHLMQTWA